MCKTKKNSSLYCPVNPCLSVHIQVQGQGETSLAVGQSNVHFAFQPQIFSKLNTETFIYWHSVILDGSKGTSSQPVVPDLLSPSHCNFAGPVAPAPPFGSSRECQTATAPHFHLPIDRSFFPEDEIEVHMAVHGVEHVGVTWNHQLCKRGTRASINRQYHT